LEDNGIATVSCRGNVYQRNKAISAFQNAGASADQPRVLMLSLVRVPSSQRERCEPVVTWSVADNRKTRRRGPT
jgi:hypothetical protein